MGIESSDELSQERDQTALDRTSVVPLYYQLQEVLKQQIESGRWGPGDPLPPEIELGHRYGVSRVCVRQALAILEDDREIVRIQGRGTFVAARKLVFRPAGITRLLVETRPPGAVVRVLDRRIGGVEPAIAHALGATTDQVLRLTTSWAINDTPFAIGHSFFAGDEIERLDGLAQVGQDLVVREALEHVEIDEVAVSVETTQCGRFEADLLGIQPRSTLLLTSGVVHVKTADGSRPFEAMRFGYRGDVVQLRLGGSAIGDENRAWAFRPSEAGDAGAGAR